MLLKYPRYLARRVLLVLLFLSRSQRISCWKCRQSCLPRASLFGSRSRSSTLQFLVVVAKGVFKVFLPRQSSTATPSAEERISERIVEQFSPSSAKRTSERIEEQLVDTSPGVGLGQGSSSSAGPADEDFAVVFRTFPCGKKSARAAASPSAELSREVSPWTPAAYAAPSGSDEWVQFSRRGKPFYLNRRSHETFWTPPEGVKVVWSGEQTAAGRVWYWHKETRVSTFDLPPLPPG